MIDVVSALRSEVKRAAVGFRRLTESDVLRDRGQGKWVKKEILGHLIDSAGMRDECGTLPRMTSYREGVQQDG